MAKRDIAKAKRLRALQAKKDSLTLRRQQAVVDLAKVRAEIKQVRSGA